MSGGLPAVLAIDGGNSKTDVALVAADGTLLGSARGPGVPAKLSGQTVAMLATIVGQAARDAGLHAGLARAAGTPIARHTIACMANADLPEDEHRLAGMLREQGWSDTTEVANDTFAVLRAGLDPAGGSWGVGVTCGAGINCVGVAPDGRTTGFLALGQITGDWGGGYGLGLQTLWWAMRAEDGRGPGTALRAAVTAHFGVPEVRDVAVRVHHGTIVKDGLAELAPVLFAVAASGDQVARDLVSHQADEVCAMALTVMRRLDLTGLATPVVLGGRVLTARHPLLTGWITERLAAGAPAADVRVTDVPPIAGAALLGLDQTGAQAGAKLRLHAAYLAVS
ncbi:MAG TPA: BadF/BadG/BcrA/BcrD ATPase family protein [Streptosporangiaceae bacterium]